MHLFTLTSCLQTDILHWACTWERKCPSERLHTFFGVSPASPLVKTPENLRTRAQQEILYRIHPEPVEVLIMFLTRNRSQIEKTKKPTLDKKWRHKCRRHRRRCQESFGWSGPTLVSMSCRQKHVRVDMFCPVSAGGSTPDLNPDFCVVVNASEWRISLFSQFTDKFMSESGFSAFILGLVNSIPVGSLVKSHTDITLKI